MKQGKHLKIFSFFIAALLPIVWACLILYFNQYSNTKYNLNPFVFNFIFVAVCGLVVTSILFQKDAQIIIFKGNNTLENKAWKYSYNTLTIIYTLFTILSFGLSLIYILYGNNFKMISFCNNQNIIFGYNDTVKTYNYLIGKPYDLLWIKNWDNGVYGNANIDDINFRRLCEKTNI